MKNQTGDSDFVEVSYEKTELTNETALENFESDNDNES